MRRRSPLFVLLLCALFIVRVPDPIPPLFAATSGLTTPAAMDGCTDALEAHEMLKSSLALDGAAASRAQDLAQMAAASNTVPSSEQLEAVARSGSRSIESAGNALEKNAAQFERALVRAGRNTPLQEFRKRWQPMRDQRTRWERWVRDERRYINLSPQGNLTPTPAYEAAESYVQAAEELTLIAQQTPTFISEGGWTIHRVDADRMPPPNPGWHPVGSAYNLMKGGLNGLRTAVALGRKQFPLATQYANAMQQSVQDAASQAAAIESALSPCRTNLADNAPKPKGGPGAGTLVSLLVAAGTLGGACLYVCDDLAALSETGLDGGSGGGPPTYVSHTPWICSNATKQCTGTVTLRFHSVPSAGYAVVFSSSSFAGGSPVTKAENVTFDMTRNYNTCYGTQTALAVWNGTTANGPNTWSVSVNIPVSCQ